MRHAPDAVMAGCEIIVAFLHEHGREAEAKPWVDRYRGRQSDEQRAFEERQALRTTDTFIAHGMPAAELATLVERLAGHERVRRARLVRKQCRLSAEPLYAVGIELHTPWYRFVSADEGADVAQDLARSANWPVEIFFVPINRNNRGFRRVFRRFEGSLIYSR